MNEFKTIVKNIFKINLKITEEDICGEIEERYGIDLKSIFVYIAKQLGKDWVKTTNFSGIQNLKIGTVLKNFYDRTEGFTQEDLLAKAIIIT